MCIFAYATLPTRVEDDTLTELLTLGSGLMGISWGRLRARLAPIGGPVPKDDAWITQVALPPGVLGRWLRFHGLDEVQVSSDIAPGRLRAAAYHVKSHGTTALADALLLIVCSTPDCVCAPALLAPTPGLRAAGG